MAVAVKKRRVSGATHTPAASVTGSLSALHVAAAGSVTGPVEAVVVACGELRGGKVPVMDFVVADMSTLMVVVLLSCVVERLWREVAARHARALRQLYE
ncbi:unnamed protein product, partial [Effrenium voratum]